MGRSLVARLVADRGKRSVERAEHRLRLEEELLVAVEPDPSTDEGLLGVELARGDCDGGLPVLFHLDVFGFRRPGPEHGGAVADRQVIGDIAFRSIAHHLGHADAMGLGNRTHLVAGGDLGGQRTDPVEAEVSDHAP